LTAESFALRQSLPGWLIGTDIVLALLLGLGWLTPIASLIALASHVAVWSLVDVPGVAMLSVMVLDAFALSLLGPGAYSVDSYRYGRRVVVVRPP
jgi:hypothetical protein